MNIKLAERMKERRKALGMTQEDLALASELTQSQISRYERGENDPTGEALIALAKALITSSDYLLGNTNNFEPLPKGIEDLQVDEIELLGAYRSKPKDRKLIILKLVRDF